MVTKWSKQTEVTSLWKSTPISQVNLTTDLDLDTTLMPTFENMRKLQKEKHRSVMVIFRKRKKETLERQQQECRRLERELKRFAKAARAKTASSEEEGSDRASTHTMSKLQKLVVDWESLSRENRALRDEIKRRKVFEEVVRKPNQADVEAETLTLLPGDSHSGHRIHFDHKAPSFHFYPFSRAEFDTGMKHFKAELTKGIQSVVIVGNVFGWDVYRAPLETKGLQRVQLKKRLNCSLDQILRESYEKEECLCPMVVTPVGFSLYQRHSASTKVLQEFSEDACVCVCNIPGPAKHLRFMYFFRQTQSKSQDGRRRIELSVSLADSTLNRYSRDADEAHNVEWATEGGIHVSLTEVNETAVDAVCSRWVDCKSKLHADYMMVQWTQFANLWEQAVASQCLLN